MSFPPGDGPVPSWSHSCLAYGTDMSGLPEAVSRQISLTPARSSN